MKKIVRTELSIDNDSYVYDKVFDDTKSNQENCNLAIKDVANTAEANGTLAVSCYNALDNSSTSFIPALVFTRNIKVVKIKSAKVYEVKEPEPTDDVR